MTEAALPADESGPRNSASSECASACPTGSVGRLVSFIIDDERYGIDVMSVRQIRGWSKTVYLPKQSEYVCGAIDPRGSPVPIIDLRCRLGRGLTVATKHHIVIVVQVGGRFAGLLGDKVVSMVAFEQSRLQPVPHVTDGRRVDFLSRQVSIRDAMVTLIDLQKLLEPLLSEPLEMSVVH